MALEAVPEESIIPNLSYTVRMQTFMSELKLIILTDSTIPKIDRGEYLMQILFMYSVNNFG